MAKLIVYFAHPGHRFSQVNKKMFAAAKTESDITIVDLYAEYPRFDISIECEQQRLLAHDIILFQFPLFWYSTPSIIKEWQDLVLEHGFAYGAGGDKLAGKRMMLAITAAGPADAYTPQGYQRHQMRDFLRPLQQTATLCKMTFLPPYVLYEALRAADTDQITPHVAGYRQLLAALRDDKLGHPPTGDLDVLTYKTLPKAIEG